jgi:Fe-Mn family superoxide dismutase
MYTEILKWQQIVEGKRETLELEKLPYGKTDLAPALSKETLDYHYSKLAKAYVDRFNKGEGDPKFNKAGAFLHNILFPQYQKSAKRNDPQGAILEFINKHFKSYDKFKEEFSKSAMTIQGSGWVYLSNSGKIKTIVNHEIRDDIVLLIDWWEHAFALDYQSDKQKYLENQWTIINWNLISSRIGLSS